MIRARVLRFCSTAILLVVLALLLPGSTASYAAVPAVPRDGRTLLAKYPPLSSKLQKNQFAAPIYLESRESQGSQQVDMYGVFNYPYEAVRDALRVPGNWCDITTLHINIKACTAKKTADNWLLTIYSGRKNYQVPADAYPLKLQFRVFAQQPDYLDLVLTADEGPLRTKDHRIRLEAAPLDQGRTFIHFSYSYSHGAVANMAIKTYFATLGRDKLGFSTETGKSGNQVYIGGVRGAVERNTVRYYLALQTYMDTLKYPEPERFEQRLSRWYDMTARYTRQLKEVEKFDYITNKRHEHLNQIALQNREGR
jgi:hypothetical protein